MSADEHRAVQVDGPRIEPEGTATLIAGLDEILGLMERDGDHDPLAVLAVRAQLATALAVEHAALELALTRELLGQVAERWDT
jgi:hypothetical protein